MGLWRRSNISLRSSWPCACCCPSSYLIAHLSCEFILSACACVCVNLWLCHRSCRSNSSVASTSCPCASVSLGSIGLAAASSVYLFVYSNIYPVVQNHYIRPRRFSWSQIEITTTAATAVATTAEPQDTDQRNGCSSVSVENASAIDPAATAVIVSSRSSTGYYRLSSKPL